MSERKRIDVGAMRGDAAKDRKQSNRGSKASASDNSPEKDKINLSMTSKQKQRLKQKAAAAGKYASQYVVDELELDEPMTI